MGKFKRGTCVVIQPADEPMIDLEWDLSFFQKCLDVFKVVPAILAQVAADKRQRSDNRLVLRHFAIEYAQWIRHYPSLAIRTHARDSRFESSAQRLIVFCPILRVSDGVD